MKKVLQRITQKNVYPNTTNVESGHEITFLPFQPKSIVCIYVILYVILCVNILFNFKVQVCKNRFHGLLRAEIQKILFVISK